MSQFLPRGYEIGPNKRIRRMISEESDWQIYLTNVDSYVLAVKQKLYNRWGNDYSLPKGLFSDYDNGSIKVLSSTGDFLIASLEKGPYPEDKSQIEAFSIVFKATLEEHPNVDLHDAIYIEEYGLLLPTSFEKTTDENDVIYGKWVTGGIGISIESFDRVSKIMSWIPAEYLIESAKLAGFDVSGNETGIERKAEKNRDTSREETPTVADPEVRFKEKFKLTGRPELEQFFNDNIIDIVLHQEQYKRMGIPFPGATILYGPPGCGKTYAIERLSEYLGWKRFDIDSSTIASPYIHDTSKKISEVFDQATKSAPSIIVIDEMEAFLSSREMAGSSGMHHVEEVAEFLRRIPDAVSNGVLIFAMTNMLDRIDPAIIRRGRFDHIIEVKMANSEEIEALLSDRFKELPIDGSVQIKKIAKALDGHPMSDVAFILREAGRFAVKNGLEDMSQECFENAINLLPKAKEKSHIGFTNK